MIIHNILQQGTEEWFAIRKGKMTASSACEIGNAGKGLDTYINKLMAEFYSSGERESFSNADTKRGIELEAQARDLYELRTMSEVSQVGFIENDEYSGCSLDGLVDEDGLIEIKCPKDEVYFKYLLNGEKEIDSKYIWQMQMQMMISNRKWCDFLAYNPNYKPTMFTKRIFADEDTFDKLRIGLGIGRAKIEDIKSKI